MRYLVLLMLLTGCNLFKDYPVKLVKVYTKDIVFKRGEKFTYAKVESMKLCLSIAEAYNYARTRSAIDPSAGSFGLWDSYIFQCE